MFDRGCRDSVACIAVPYYLQTKFGSDDANYLLSIDKFRTKFLLQNSDMRLKRILYQKIKKKTKNRENRRMWARLESNSSLERQCGKLLATKSRKIIVTKFITYEKVCRGFVWISNDLNFNYKLHSHWTKIWILMKLRITRCT